MKLRISKASKNTRITFSKTDDEIRLKVGDNFPLENEDNIFFIINEVEKFYLDSDISFTLRGTFLFRLGKISLSLRNLNKVNFIHVIQINGNLKIQRVPEKI